MYLSRVKTTGAMQVHSELPGDSNAIVLAVLANWNIGLDQRLFPCAREWAWCNRQTSR